MNPNQMKTIAGKYKGKRLSPLKSIKAYCKEMCCCGDLDSWKNCTCLDCFLYKYRLGQGSRKLSQKLNSTMQFSGEGKL